MRGLGLSSAPMGPPPSESPRIMKIFYALPFLGHMQFQPFPNPQGMSLNDYCDIFQCFGHLPHLCPILQSTPIFLITCSMSFLDHLIII